MTKYKTQQNQRVALHTMVDPEVKSALDEAKEGQQVSLAHLIDSILREHFTLRKKRNDQFAQKTGEHG